MAITSINMSLGRSSIQGPVEDFVPANGDTGLINGRDFLIQVHTYYVCTIHIVLVHTYFFSIHILLPHTSHHFFLLLFLGGPLHHLDASLSLSPSLTLSLSLSLSLCISRSHLVPVPSCPLPDNRPLFCPQHRQFPSSDQQQRRAPYHPHTPPHRQSFTSPLWEEGSTLKRETRSPYIRFILYSRYRGNHHIRSLVPRSHPPNQLSTNLTFAHVLTSVTLNRQYQDLDHAALYHTRTHQNNNNNINIK
jgi:hypothetical protein